MQNHEALLLLAPAPILALLAVRGDTQSTLTPAQMQEDLFRLTEEFESLHAGLLRYTSREELDEAFGDTLFELEDDRTELEFYRRVAALVSKVRCGHTRAQPNPRVRAVAESRRGLLPIEVFLRNDRLFIVRSLDGSLSPGTEILSIDGISIAAICDAAFAHMSSDGFNETFKERQLERSFARTHALLVQQAVRVPSWSRSQEGPSRCASRE